MKIKFGYITMGAGLLSMLSGILLKEKCEKCGGTLFGFGLAHILCGMLSLLKNENCIPESVPLPMGNLEIDMQ